MRLTNPEIPQSVLLAWGRADGNIPYNPRSIDTTEWDKTLAKIRDEAGFHWRGGVYFKRERDGSVCVTHFCDWNYTPNYVQWIIPANEWASVVASVSSDGENHKTFQAALKAHGE